MQQLSGGVVLIDEREPRTQVQQLTREHAYAIADQFVFASTLQNIASIPTLSQVWHEYKLTGRLKDSTIRGYRKVMNCSIPDWIDLPITAITSDVIQVRHRELTDRSPSLANGAMRIVRALFNFAAYKYKLPLINPTKCLSETKAWNRNKRRKTYIAPHQMQTVIQSIMGMENATYRDFLLFLLLMGTRKSETLLLGWQDVDLLDRTVLLRDTKNGDDALLPLPNFLHSLLVQRRTVQPDEVFVFPGESQRGHVSTHNRCYKAISEASGVTFTPHDCRRTFATVADMLDMSKHLIKRLLNHRTQDVTDGYIITTPERLRGPIQRIEDEILRMAQQSELVLLATSANREMPEPKGPLEIEILTYMTMSKKHAFSIQNVWESVGRKRKITQDTVRITLRRLFQKSCIMRVDDGDGIVLYSLPLRSAEQRTKSGRTRRFQPVGVARPTFST
jgi:integrase